MKLLMKEELQAMLNRRMNYLHPLNGEPLRIRGTFKTIKVLYEYIEKKIMYIIKMVF